MTSAELWTRLKPVIGTALELSPEDRPRYLDAACQADIGLRSEAARILDACERASSSLGFLDAPAVELAAPLLDFEAELLESSGDLVPGVAVGPYMLERRLGAGGMGVVYLARDPRLDRRVALKLLPAWIPVDDASSRHLTEEARAASRLDHPNIQTVYEIGSAPDGRPFIAMAYYEGETLKDRLARGPLDLEDARDLTRQMAEGLGAAHRQGIVHRDVKPGNVMVTPEGLVKVLDFGAAKIAGHGLDRYSRVIGTVSYMSPEQTRAEDVDARTDVWSLGVVIYEMLTGRRPFTGDDVDAVVRAVREEQPAPLLQGLRPEVPPELVRIVERCLEKAPERRFPDAASVADEPVLARPPGDASRPGARRRPRPSTLAVAAGLAILAFQGVRMATDRRAASRAVLDGSQPVPSSPATSTDGRPEGSFEGRQPLGPALSIEPPLALVTNVSEGTVSVIDLDTNRELTAIPVGVGPEDVVLSPDGHQAYVTDRSADLVLMIDLTSGRVMWEVHTGFGPQGLAVTPDGRTLYVANMGENDVRVVHLEASGPVLGERIPVGVEPMRVTMAPGGARVYVPNRGSWDVSVIDVSTDAVVSVIAGLRRPYQVAFAPDGRTAYVTGNATGELAVIDLTGDSVVAWVPVGPAPEGVAVSPDGTYAYVANQGSNDVSVVATATHAVVATVPVDSLPQQIAFDGSGAFAFVTNNGSGTVSVIDVGTHSVSETIQVGDGASGIALFPVAPSAVVSSRPR